MLYRLHMVKHSNFKGSSTSLSEISPFCREESRPDVDCAFLKSCLCVIRPEAPGVFCFHPKLVFVLPWGTLGPMSFFFLLLPVPPRARSFHSRRLSLSDHPAVRRGCGGARGACGVKNPWKTNHEYHNLFKRSSFLHSKGFQ